MTERTLDVDISPCINHIIHMTPFIQHHEIEEVTKRWW